MSIIKIHKRENPYVQIDKRPLNNENLSWGAKGVLAYLLSKPDNWETNVKDLVKKSTNGRDAVYGFIDELIEAGHIERNVYGLAGGGSKAEYIVHESPIERITENPDSDARIPEKPYTVNPNTEIPTHNNKELLNNNDLYTPEIGGASALGVEAPPKKPTGKKKEPDTMKFALAEDVKMTIGEVEKLQNQYPVHVVVWMIEKLNNYKLANGKKYKSDYRAILNWVAPEAEKHFRIKPSQQGPTKKLIGHHHTIDYGTNKPIQLPVYEGDTLPRFGFVPLP